MCGGVGRLLSLTLRASWINGTSICQSLVITSVSVLAAHSLVCLFWWWKLFHTTSYLCTKAVCIQFWISGWGNGLCWLTNFVHRVPVWGCCYDEGVTLSGIKFLCMLNFCEFVKLANLMVLSLLQLLNLLVSWCMLINARLYISSWQQNQREGWWVLKNVWNFKMWQIFKKSKLQN